MTRLRWPEIIAAAAVIVGDFSGEMSLRQLFYRLLVADVLPNTAAAYVKLSHHTASARRAGTFPALVDGTRRIEQAASWDSPADALRALTDQYRRPRDEGQPRAIWLAIEKRALAELLRTWFADLGVPIVALAGFASEPLERAIIEHIERDGRPSILIYAGDHDPSGVAIISTFRVHVPFDAVHQVAVTPEQVVSYQLPQQPVKRRDPRARGFVARYGELGVELDALDPDALRQLYQAQIDQFWDADAHRRSLAREAEERARLVALVPPHAT